MRRLKNGLGDSGLLSIGLDQDHQQSLHCIQSASQPTSRMVNATVTCRLSLALLVAVGRSSAQRSRRLPGAEDSASHQAKNCLLNVWDG